MAQNDAISAVIGAETPNPAACFVGLLVQQRAADIQSFQVLKRFPKEIFM